MVNKKKDTKKHKMNKKLIIALTLLVAVAIEFSVYLSQKPKEPEQPVVQKPEEGATSIEEKSHMVNCTVTSYG